MFDADRGAGSSRWQVLRLRGGCSADIVLLSRSFFAVSTHWTGCTVACAGEGCELCELLPGRGLFYVAAMCIARVHLVELGAQSASHMEQQAKLLHGGLTPGQEWTLRRRTDKAPIYTECTGQRQASSEVLPLQIAAKVMALYKYPCPNPTENLEQYDARIHASAVLRCKRLAEQIKAGKQERV